MWCSLLPCRCSHVKQQQQLLLLLPSLRCVALRSSLPGAEEGFTDRQLVLLSAVYSSLHLLLCWFYTAVSSQLLFFPSILFNPFNPLSPLRLPPSYIRGSISEGRSHRGAPLTRQPTETHTIFLSWCFILLKPSRDVLFWSFSAHYGTWTQSCLI